jgi:hypothetical protein
VEETELIPSELRDCLAHVGSVLARAEDALGKLQVASVMPLLPELQDCSIVEGAPCLHGDFSPRYRHCPTLLHAASSTLEFDVITEVVAPVLQILHELQKFVEKHLWYFGRRWAS